MWHGMAGWQAESGPGTVNFA
ncbi:MAG: hypothetical protein RLZZ558_1441, partial [Planctomycetota bacterium]